MGVVMEVGRGDRGAEGAMGEAPLVGDGGRPLRAPERARESSNSGVSCATPQPPAFRAKEARC